MDARADRQSDPGKEEGQHFQLEIVAVRNGLHEQQIHPFGEDVYAEHKRGHFLHFSARKGDGEKGKQLKDRHSKQHPSPVERCIRPVCRSRRSRFIGILIGIFLDRDVPPDRSPGGCHNASPFCAVRQRMHKNIHY